MKTTFTANPTFVSGSKEMLPRWSVGVQVSLTMINYIMVILNILGFSLLSMNPSCVRSLSLFKSYPEM